MKNLFVSAAVLFCFSACGNLGGDCKPDGTCKGDLVCVRNLIYPSSMSYVCVPRPAEVK